VIIGIGAGLEINIIVKAETDILKATMDSRTKNIVMRSLGKGAPTVEIGKVVAGVKKGTNAL